jgi:hypothetical protein
LKPQPRKAATTLVASVGAVTSRNRLTKFNLNHSSNGIKTRIPLPKKEW